VLCLIFFIILLFSIATNLKSHLTTLSQISTINFLVLSEVLCLHGNSFELIPNFFELKDMSCWIPDICDVHSINKVSKLEVMKYLKIVYSYTTFKVTLWTTPLKYMPDTNFTNILKFMALSNSLIGRSNDLKLPHSMLITISPNSRNSPCHFEKFTMST
jgi:hypothetical protein